MIVAISSKSLQALNRPDSAVSGTGLGLPSHELILTYLNNELIARSHSLEVKPVNETCDQVWPNKAVITQKTTVLLRLALEQPSNLCWEPASSMWTVARKHVEKQLYVGPTDLEVRWDIPPWTMTYLAKQSPEAADNLLSPCACPTSVGFNSWLLGKRTITLEKGSRF